MVSLEPDFEEVLELPVLSDVARRKMAVIVEDWFRSRKLVIKSARCVCEKEKVVVNEVG
jgi:hypothetical protein